MATEGTGPAGRLVGGGRPLGVRSFLSSSAETLEVAPYALIETPGAVGEGTNSRWSKVHGFTYRRPGLFAMLGPSYPPRVFGTRRRSPYRRLLLPIW